MIAVEVRGLAKNYPAEDSQWARLRHILTPGPARSRQGLWALRGVSFSVEKGEAFGIVGANGSGKSTLLQIIAGILRPTEGAVSVYGRLAALLELGSGFSPEFTGRENVFLNAAILGFSREETQVRFPAIERFASIGDFIDQPIRTYSSGMVLRLAFAVVSHIDPEILIVDEALAVGDIAFRQRCMRRIHELRAAGTTILYVSHDTSDLKALCERCLWLEAGEVRAIGESDDVVARYLSAGLEAAAPVLPGQDLLTTTRIASAHRFGNGKARVTGTALREPWKAHRANELRVSFSLHAAIEAPIVGFLIRNGKGETIFGSNTMREDYQLPSLRAGENRAVAFYFAPPELSEGRYLISVAVSEGSLEEFQVCDYVEDALAVDVRPLTDVRGYLGIKCRSVTVHRGTR